MARNLNHESNATMSNITLFSSSNVPAFARNNELSDTAKALTGGSVSNVTEMQRKLQAQKTANLRASQANERIASEVRDLKEGLEMIEEKARMELGMVKPHEIYIQVSAAQAKK